MEEKHGILELLNSDQFVDLPPAQAFARLLDEGRYLASRSTFYRILSELNAALDRRRQREHAHREPPRLLATGPNQVWTGDISKLRGPEKWVFYFLYVLLDLYSRFVIAWMITVAENSELFKTLIEQGYQSQGLTKNCKVVVHTDNGKPMTAKTTSQFEMDLGLLQSTSRPRVSNDNPFSEANFKTLKYRPETPDRFGSQEHALSWGRVILPWYNTKHYHSGLGYLTPASVHYGRADQILKERAKVMNQAFAARPDRFNNRPPKPYSLPRQVWINKPTGQELQIATPGIVTLNSQGCLSHPA